MNKRLFLLMILVSTGGCATYENPRGRMSPEETSRREDQRLAEEQNVRMRSFMQDTQQELNQLRTELHQTDSRVQNSTTGQQIASLEMKLSNLENRLVALESSRQKDKQEIIERLSKSMSEIIKTQEKRYVPPAQINTSRHTPDPVNQEPISDSGYMHVVDVGETLSAIAAAYNVSSSVIIRANKLKNPNQLRVGQKLFIPE